MAPRGGQCHQADQNQQEDIAFSGRALPGRDPEGDLPPSREGIDRPGMSYRKRRQGTVRCFTRPEPR
jgi:hypothetical protein